MCMLHGVTMLQAEAMPTCDFLKSSRVNPTACSMARPAARSYPSTTSADQWRWRETPFFFEAAAPLLAGRGLGMLIYRMGGKGYGGTASESKAAAKWAEAACRFRLAVRRKADLF